ncbi:MAG: PaaI family thioesterase [Evtepia sp.]
MDFSDKIELTNTANTFMIHNYIRLTHMEEDLAIVELDLHPESRNLFGYIHGGVFFTMADSAAGGAARSRGKRYVTLSNSFEFYRNTKENGIIRAIGKVRRRGQTICVVAVDVLDENDRLLAGGTFTMFCTGDVSDALK